MMSFLGGQVGAFLWSVAIGGIAALIYDLYRAIGAGMRLSRWRIGVGDVVFWAVLTALVFMLLVVGNAGDVRWYILFGLALGYGFYRRVFEQKGYRFWRGFLAGGGRVSRFAFRPFLVFGRVLAWPIKRMAGLFCRRSTSSPPPPPDDSEL